MLILNMAEAVSNIASLLRSTRLMGRVAWGITGVYLAILSYFLLASDPLWFLGDSGTRGVDTIDSTLGDRAEHFLAYGLLVFLMASAANWTRYPSLAVCVVVSVGHGAVAEFLQSFVPDRFCDPVDAVSNAIGVVVGLGVIGALRWFGAFGGLCCVGSMSHLTGSQKNPPEMCVHSLTPDPAGSGGERVECGRPQTSRTPGPPETAEGPSC